jgi:hypothetical protein
MDLSRDRQIEEEDLLGYDAVWSVEREKHFACFLQRAMNAAFFHVGTLHGLFLDPEDGGDMCPPKRWFSADYIALYPT